MITPQLTEQYGQVLRVSLARGILSPWVWAWRGVRSNPRTESPAPPARVPFKKFLRENSITASAWREQGSTEFMVMAVAKAASLRCSNGENYTSWFSAPSMTFRGHGFDVAGIARRSAGADNRCHVAKLTPAAHREGRRAGYPVPVCRRDAALLRACRSFSGRVVLRCPANAEEPGADRFVRTTTGGGGCRTLSWIPVLGRGNRSRPGCGSSLRTAESNCKPPARVAECLVDKRWTCGHWR